MPRRNLVLADGEIYHVFNRSIAKEPIFNSESLSKRSVEIINFYRFPQRVRLSKFKTLTATEKDKYTSSINKLPPLVEIYSYAMMPNHYHFLLKQKKEDGIKKFVSNFQNSFAKAYNLINRRDGSLFQNSFKARRIATDEEFVHVSRYIHLNPVTSYLIKSEDLKDYPFTSFQNYLDHDNDTFVNTALLLDLFKSVEDYEEFVKNQVDYQRSLSIIRDLLIEEESSWGADSSTPLG